MRLLHKLAKGKHSPDRLPPPYHAIRLEPDANDPAIGYKSLPAKSWWVHYYFLLKVQFVAVVRRGVP